MIDTAFAHRIGLAAGLRADAVDDLSHTIEAIRETLDEDERADFALSLMDCVRSAAASNVLAEVLNAWWLTSQIRRHPDYAWQKKEYDNLVASGELQMEIASYSSGGLQPA